ncbi:hypothetical protein [Massilia sp. BJB1822]|uniref:hypothetical protein n=1 Tax=Massilia sp. BJB1822 TaxID=2744470 RepID=UPI0015949D65|nr:hypothetical protein [Massilia sp. BJB1822]NVD97260.1 hypothetical protein [Massilia sp. BJB1822]
MPTTAIKIGLLDFVAVGDSSYARSLSDVNLPRASSTWLLGTGEASMLLASKQGASYCHSLFHSGALQDPNILHTFRDRAENGRTPPQSAQIGLYA